LNVVTDLCRVSEVWEVDTDAHAGESTVTSRRVDR
jgi:hypothetical protein